MKTHKNFWEITNMPRDKTLVVAVNDIEGTTVKKDDVVLYMGEIANMQGHIIFVTRDNKIYWG